MARPRKQVVQFETFPIIRPGMKTRDVLLNAMVEPCPKRFAPGTIWSKVAWYHWPSCSNRAEVTCLICQKPLGPTWINSAKRLEEHGRVHVPDELVDAFEALMRLTDPRSALQQLVQTGQIV